MYSGHKTKRKRESACVRACEATSVRVSQCVSLCVCERLCVSVCVCVRESRRWMIWDMHRRPLKGAWSDETYLSEMGAERSGANGPFSSLLCREK